MESVEKVTNGLASNGIRSVLTAGQQRAASLKNEQRQGRVKFGKRKTRKLRAPHVATWRQTQWGDKVPPATTRPNERRSRLSQLRLRLRKRLLLPGYSWGRLSEEKVDEGISNLQCVEFQIG
jgi:hypothetical protein